MPVISLYNITTLSTGQVLKVKKVIMYTLGILSFVQDCTVCVSEKETIVWKCQDFILKTSVTGLT